MNLASLVLVAVALAMDAFAVAVAAAMAIGRLTPRRVFRLAFHFGLFQALMPIIGWLAGSAIRRYITTIDHWAAFALLTLVGGRMLLGAMGGGDARRASSDPTTGWALVVLSVATSIDALAVGLSLAMLDNAILVEALVIGLVTMALTAIGMVLGRRLGKRWGPRVEVAGGILLIAIGVRILVSHLT